MNGYERCISQSSTIGGTISHMRLGWFDTVEPVPALRNPHVIMVIPSWLNAGESACLALHVIEEHADAQPLGLLISPGEFFDFTRYRPTMTIKDNATKLEVPNAIVTYGKTQTTDFIFLRLPEPHMRSERYVESVLELFKYFKVKRYCLMGSIYEMLPHTRPPILTGSASNKCLQNSIEIARVLPSDYEGPASFLNLIGKEAEELGIETMSLMVHLPVYLQLSGDHRGETRLLEVFNSLYGIPVPPEDIERSKEESDQIDSASEAFLRQNPQFRYMLTQLENNYDARIKNQKQTRLSPEVEKYLQELSRRFESG